MLSTAIGYGATVLGWFIGSQVLMARLVLLVGCAAMVMVLLESIR